MVALLWQFQKVFDTVDHDILHKNLGHYGIKRISNKQVASYLSKRK